MIVGTCQQAMKVMVVLLVGLHSLAGKLPQVNSYKRWQRAAGFRPIFTGLYGYVDEQG